MWASQKQRSQHVTLTSSQHVPLTSFQQATLTSLVSCRFVHAINVNAFTYRLQYLHARFPDRDFLTCAGALCPDIKELLIEDQVWDQNKCFGITVFSSTRVSNYKSASNTRRERKEYLHFFRTYPVLRRQCFDPKIVSKCW